MWRSGSSPSQCYGQIASPHMTATHSQTDRYKHIAFSRQEGHSKRAQETERMKDKHFKSTPSVNSFSLFTAKQSLCSPVHFELKTLITVFTSTALHCVRDIEPSPDFKQKPKISLLYSAIQVKNFHSFMSLFPPPPLSRSCVLQHSSSILFFCLSTAGNDSFSPPCSFFFPLCSLVSLLLGGDGRSWCFINSFLVFALCPVTEKICCILLQCSDNV